MGDEEYDVVIVGAGLSGLACAGALPNHLRVLLLEAQPNRVGGRVYPASAEDLGINDKFPGLLLDVGAEIVHGDGTVLHQYAAEEGWLLRQIFVWAHGDGGPLDEEAPDGGAGYYYVGRERKLYRFNELDAELEHLKEELDLLCETTPSVDQEDWSLQRYLESRGVTRKALAMAHAGFGNTVGADLEHLSLKNVCRVESLWDEDGGDRDFRISPSCGPLLERMKKHVSATIRTGSPVQAIKQNADGKGMTIDYKTGLDHGSSDDVKLATVKAKCVVVTVPLPVLQGKYSAEAIQFQPPLKQDKQDAIGQLVVGGGMKIIVSFKAPFWPKDMHGAICADCVIPEFWVKDVGAFVDAQCNLVNEANLPSSTHHVLVGYLMAGSAASVSHYSQEQLIQLFVRQLDDVFGDNVASASFTGGFVFDWSKVPYIRGGYSSPGLLEKDDSRALYARPECDGQLLFAGEASDFEQAYMTMHAAIRTGERAAAEASATLAPETPTN
eukprot:CAMPEP_0184555034 /NCGR_PEP_ID=MMETSP0199_2-20130426/36589_1 /TAXON_ID=1112570 /ORGANISM="Thraustochytrium sp., Strain LLF1b" /LENGTH=496 /DNA_ID=CAMNT_0026951269 /DNA_START=87 /DNA_END=1577 /DNA_ORIENTATION=+